MCGNVPMESDENGVESASNSNMASNTSNRLGEEAVSEQARKKRKYPLADQIKGDEDFTEEVDEVARYKSISIASIGLDRKVF